MVSYSQPPVDPQALEDDSAEDSLRAGLPEQVGDAVDETRRAFRAHAAEEWSLAIPLVRTPLDLCATLHARRLALDGRTDTELFREVLNRSLKPSEEPPDFATHSDAEIFLGLLCVESSRSRVMAWEIGVRGAALVEEAFDRIRRAAPDRDVRPEGVHWALALVDRVRDGSVEPAFLSLAVRLLRLSAGSAPRVLADYLEKQGGACARLLAGGELPDVLTASDLERLLGMQLVRALDDAAATGDLNGLEQACERLGLAGVQLSMPGLLREVDARIDRVAAAVRERSALRHRASRMTELHRLLAAVLPLEWRARLLTKSSAGRRHWSWPVLTRPPRVTAAVASVAVVGLLVFRFIDVAAAPEAGGGAEAGTPRDGAEAGTPRDGAEAGTPRDGAEAGTPRDGAEAGTPTGGEVTGTRPGGAAAATSEGTALRLMQARLPAAAGDWARVVQLLTAEEPDATSPQVIQWDSLLAVAAFRHASALPAGDPERDRLLRLAHERSTRSIAANAAFAPAADELRLLRAEACVAGRLACVDGEVTEDLLLAARSPSRAISDRARVLLTGQRR